MWLTTRASLLLLCRFSNAGYDDAIHGLMRPAFEKRQGTKSREVGHGLGSKRYGDLMSALSSIVGGTLARRHPHVCREWRPGECDGHLGERSERINTRSAH